MLVLCSATVGHTHINTLINTAAEWEAQYVVNSRKTGAALSLSKTLN